MYSGQTCTHIMAGVAAQSKTEVNRRSPACIGEGAEGGCWNLIQSWKCVRIMYVLSHRKI